MALDKIPTPEVSKLEWGPTLGFMSWDDAQEKITKLNSKLTRGEQRWRLPTKDELLLARENLISQSGSQGPFWSSTLNPDSYNAAYTVDIYNGTAHTYLKDDSTNFDARLVRDAA